MNVQQKTLALILGSAVVAGVTMAPAQADQNPFALKPLASGYMVADNSDSSDKMKDGKCSTGKCSSSMKKKKAADPAKPAAAGAEKTKEGSCSAAKAKEGSCSSEKK